MSGVEEREESARVRESARIRLFWWSDSIQIFAIYIDSRSRLCSPPLKTKHQNKSFHSFRSSTKHKTLVNFELQTVEYTLQEFLDCIVTMAPGFFFFCTAGDGGCS